MIETPRRRLLLGGMAAPLLAAPAYAQSWSPNRPVRIVVPIAPGGATDMIARLIGERLSPILGQPVVVENRPGAGGNIGSDAVAKADKDGLTWLFTAANVLTANPYLYRDRMPFDPVRDLVPVTRVCLGTLLWVVNSDRPWRTFQEQIEFAKRNPGRVTMGSSGTGTSSHLFFEWVKRATGADMTHVPYRGGGPAIQDLVAGNIDMMFDVIPALLPHVRSGRFRPLAAGSAKRIDYVPELANIPGMEEVLPGKGVDALNWWCFVTARGTPAPAIATMHAALRNVIAQPDLKQRLIDLTVFPMTDESPEAFGAFWQSQIPVWRQLVEASGATAS